MEPSPVRQALPVVSDLCWASTRLLYTPAPSRITRSS